MADFNDYSLLPVPTIQSMLNSWLAAMTALAQGQEYNINGRHLRRADSAEVGRMVADLSRSLQKASGTLLPTAQTRFVLPYQDGDPLAQVGHGISPFQPYNTP